MADEDVHRIKVAGRSLEELRSFLDDANLDFGCRPVVRKEAGELLVEVYATRPQIERLRTARAAANVRLTFVENAT